MGQHDPSHDLATVGAPGAPNRTVHHAHPRGPADIVGGCVRPNVVDNADPVEADHHREPAGHRGGPITAPVQQPAQVTLDVGPDAGDRSLPARHPQLDGKPAPRYRTQPFRSRGSGRRSRNDRKDLPVGDRQAGVHEGLRWQAAAGRGFGRHLARPTRLTAALTRYCPRHGGPARSATRERRGRPQAWPAVRPTCRPSAGRPSPPGGRARTGTCVESR